MINEKDYEKFKEMYDYKRKIEYNKEKIKKRIDKMYEEFEFNKVKAVKKAAEDGSPGTFKFNGFK